MSGTQLSFTLKSSANARGVQLLGSWDNYATALPLKRDSSASTSKASAWKGAFRFSATTLPAGQRYWYYYILDGYHVSHDPSKPSTVEPTTGRRLNILDVAAASSRTSTTSSRGRNSVSGVAVGRGISPSRIVAPKPSKPYASRAVREADYSRSPVDELTGDLDALRIVPRGASISPASSLSSASSSSGSSSDGSTNSRCSCRRYGITRRGDKVLLDCGGKRCGYEDSSSDDSSSCEESGSEIDSDDEIAPARPVVRKSAAAKPAPAAAAAKKRTTATASAKRVPALTRRR